MSTNVDVVVTTDLFDASYNPEETPLLWERQPNEPLFWHNVFVTYFLTQGLTRKFKKSYYLFMEAKGTPLNPKSNAHPPKPWRNAYAEWDWLRRAYAWDVAQSDILVLQWAERLREQREAEWNVRSQAFIVVSAALETFVKKANDEADLNMSIKDITQLANLASKLGRESTSASAGDFDLTGDNIQDVAELREARWQQVKELVVDVIENESSDIEEANEEAIETSSDIN